MLVDSVRVITFFSTKNREIARFQNLVGQPPDDGSHPECLQTTFSEQTE